MMTKSTPPNRRPGVQTPRNRSTNSGCLTKLGVMTIIGCAGIVALAIVLILGGLALLITDAVIKALA